MSERIKAYEAEQFARYHYRNLISAKSSIKEFKKKK
jgi:hypothetical protein